MQRMVEAFAAMQAGDPVLQLNHAAGMLPDRLDVACRPTIATARQVPQVFTYRRLSGTAGFTYGRLHVPQNVR